MNKEKRERRNSQYIANRQKRGEKKALFTINAEIPSKQLQTLYWTEAGINAKNENRKHKMSVNRMWTDKIGIVHRTYSARHPKLSDLTFVKKEVKVETKEEMLKRFDVINTERKVAAGNREYRSPVKESISTVVRRNKQKDLEAKHEEQINNIIQRIRERKTYSKNNNNYAVVVSMNDSKGRPYDFSTTYSAHNLSRTKFIAKNLHDKMKCTQDYYSTRIIEIAEFNKPKNGLYPMPVYTLINDYAEQRQAA